MRAAIYGRISDDRAGDAAGVTRQDTDCTAFCEQRGWPIVGRYIDNDISAYSGKTRPEYRRLLADVRAGVIDVIVVWHLDRIYRHPLELEEIIDLVEAQAVTIATVTGGDYDLTTTDGRAMARVIVAFARKESEDKARRNKRKHLEVAQAGLPAGGGRPFGYEADRLTIRPDEAQLIRDAAERILAGETIRSICIDWNNRGIPGPRGGRFTQPSVKRILTSLRIAGIRAHNGAAIADAAWPAIIDPDTHRRLLATIEGRYRVFPGQGARRYLLTGFLWCHRCDHRLIARPTSKRSRTYVCTNNPDKGGCGGVRVVAEPLEELVLDQLTRAFDEHRLRDALDDHEGHKAETEALKTIGELEDRLEELAGIWAAGDITRTEWIAARRRIETDLDDARADFHRAQTRLRLVTFEGDGAALAEQWHEMTLDQQRAVIASQIDRIVIGPATRGLGKFEEDRVQISWR
jgi:site-specific DNA recombinase